MADRTVRIRLEAAVAGFNAALATSKASVQGLSKEVGQAARRNKEEMQTLGIAAAATGVAIVGGFVAAGNAAIKFESSFAGVRKTVDASESEFAAMAAGFRTLAREIPTSVHELNGIGEAAGQLGIEKSNILGFTRTMADLGVATNLAGEEAATAFARFANITQMSQGDFDRLGSTVVALGNNLATTESEISGFALRLAGAGAQVGLTEAEILGLGGALSSVGINAEAGGTAVSKVMIEMAKAAENGGDELQAFADVAGMSADQFATAFRDDPAAAISAFIEGLGNVEAAGGSLFGTLEELGITEQRMRDAMLRTAGAGDLVARSMGLANDAWAENTALTEEAEQRYATIESRIELAKNALNDLGISIGQSVSPAVGGLADLTADLAGGLADMEGPALAAVAGVGGLAGVTSLAAGGFLIAAPRIVATKDAFKTLADEMPRTVGGLRRVRAIMTGPFGIALATGAALLGLYAKSKGDAVRRGEEFAATLDLETGALTENSRAQVLKQAGDDEMLATSERLGISTSTLADAVLGEGEALEVLQSSLSAAGEGHANWGGTAEGAKSSAQQLLEWIVRLNGEYGEQTAAARRSAEQTAESERRYLDLAHALDSGVDPSMARLVLAHQDAAAAAQDGAGAADTFETEIDDVGAAAWRTAEGVLELGRMLDDLIGVHLSAAEAAVRLEQGWDDLAATLKENGSSLDINTEKGRANQQAVIDQAREIRGLIEAEHEQGASLVEVADLYDQHVGQLRDVMTQAGLTESEVDDYIDTLGLTPDEIVTMILAQTDEAETALGRVATLLGRIPRFTHTTVVASVDPRAKTTLGDDVQFRARGGGVRAGRPYMVGEEGPEIVTFGRDGFVHNASETAAMIAGGAGGGPYDAGQVDAISAAAKNQSSSVYNAALDKVDRLLDRWDQMVQREQQAATRADLTGRIAEAEADVKAAENADDRRTATDRLADARQRLADHDRDAARAAEQAAIADARAIIESRARRVANREAYEFDLMSSEEQIELLTRKLSAEQRYTDAWIDLSNQRQQILDRELDAAERAYDDGVADLNRMLDERERILAQQTALEARHSEQVGAEQQRYAESVGQAQRDATDAIEAAVAARRAALLSETTPDLAGWDHRAAVIVEAVDRETDRLLERARLLADLRGRGISEAVVDMLGLEDGPEALGQLRRLARESDDELVSLNAAVARQMAAVNDTVRDEQENANSQLARDIAGIHDELSGQLRELQDEHHVRLAEMNAEFAAEQRDLAAELAAVGRDNGRSYAEAISQGIAAGIPSIAAQVAEVQRLMRDMKAAEAAASAPKTVSGQVAEMRASLGLPADPISDAKWERWVGEGSRTMGDAERRLKEKAQLFDSGGWLQPGISLVNNQTGRPERVLTGAQYAGMSDMGETNALLRRIARAADAGQVLMLDTGVFVGEMKRQGAVS